MITFIIIAALLGLVVGSFLNVVIYRLPIILNTRWRTECTDFLKQPIERSTARFSLALPRSHCPKCKHTITAKYNIPLISFLFLRGKCPFCRQKISLRYPLVELVSCTASLFIAYYFAFSLKTALMLPLTWTLIAMVFIDLKHMILPDTLTIPLLWLGLVANSFHLFCSPAAAIIGASSGYLFLWIIAGGFKRIRKIEGMGHGDFKLLALFGAWLGWQQLFFIILASSALGTLVGLSLVICKKHGMKQPIPFGPYIALAGWVALIWGQPILNWYLTFGAWH